MQIKKTSTVEEYLQDMYFLCLYNSCSFCEKSQFELQSTWSRIKKRMFRHGKILLESSINPGNIWQACLWIKNYVFFQTQQRHNVNKPRNHIKTVKPYLNSGSRNMLSRANKYQSIHILSNFMKSMKTLGYGFPGSTNTQTLVSYHNSEFPAPS